MRETVLQYFSHSTLVNGECIVGPYAGAFCKVFGGLNASIYRINYGQVGITYLLDARALSSPLGMVLKWNKSEDFFNAVFSVHRGKNSLPVGGGGVL